MTLVTLVICGLIYMARGDLGLNIDQTIQLCILAALIGLIHTSNEKEEE